MISSSKLQQVPSVGTHIVDISGANYDDIPENFTRNSCKSCVYWEKGNASFSCPIAEKEVSKRNWFNTYSFIHGSCGKLVYHNGKVVAYAQYAPGPTFQMSKMYHTYPSEDAYLITCLLVAPGYRHQGFGRILLKSIVDDLRARGVNAVETFARKDSEYNPSGPSRFYNQFGFVTKVDNARLPLLRFELHEPQLQTRMSALMMIASDSSKLPMMRTV